MGIEIGTWLSTAATELIFAASFNVIDGTEDNTYGISTSSRWIAFPVRCMVR